MPFSLIYETDNVLLAKIGESLFRVGQFLPSCSNDEVIRACLYMIDEVQEYAYIKGEPLTARKS